MGRTVARHYATCRADAHLPCTACGPWCAEDGPCAPSCGRVSARRRSCAPCGSRGRRHRGAADDPGALGDRAVRWAPSARCRAPDARARARAPSLLLLLALGLGWSGWPGADAANFTTRNIGQSNPLAAGANKITVTLQTDADLGIGHVVTISGLSNAQVTGGFVDLADVANGGGSLFSVGAATGRAAWSAGALTLNVDDGQTMSAGTEYKFSFEVTNPDAAQDAAAVSIAASGPTHSAAPVRMETDTADLYGVADGGKPMKVIVPAFSAKTIRQSTPVAGASATLSVTLTANCDFPTGSTVTLEGLTGTQTGDASSLAVTSTCGTTPELLGTAGVWTQTEGRLVLTAANGGTSQGTSCAVSFVLQQSAADQVAPSVNVSATIKDGVATLGSIASGAMTLPSTPLYGVSDGANPLLSAVPAFTTRSIQQSSTSPGASNSITVTLMANYHLATGSTVTITGLTGSQTSQTEIVVTSTSGLLGTTGAWAQDTGTLVLTAATGGTQAATACAVTFSLTNPSTAQESPPVSIQASIQLADGATASISKVAMVKPNASMCGVENGANPLTVVVSLSCADGTFPGETQCETCPAGYFCNRNSTHPMPCPAGTASSASALKSVSQCHPCPTGRIALSPGSTNCTACPAGYNCPSASSVGSQCSQGYYSPFGQHSCSVCPAGYSCADPAEEPTRCQDGYFSQAGAVSCIQCAAGKFCPVSPASSLPMTCPDGEYSTNGKTACSACTAGYFAVARISDNCTLSSGRANCTRCPAGHSCERDGEDS